MVFWRRFCGDRKNQKTKTPVTIVLLNHLVIALNRFSKENVAVGLLESAQVLMGTSPATEHSVAEDPEDSTRKLESGTYATNVPAGGSGGKVSKMGSGKEDSPDISDRSEIYRLVYAYRNTTEKG